jgi:hypothetical protein
MFAAADYRGYTLILTVFPTPLFLRLPDSITTVAVIYMPDGFPGARFELAAPEWYRVVDNAPQAHTSVP